MKRRTGDTPAVPDADAARSSTTDSQKLRLVATGEHSAGFVGYDDLGRPCWSWMDELDPALERAEADDVIRALDTDALSLVDEPGAAPVRRAGKEKGYDPYDTARIKVGHRFRRR